MNEKAWQTDAIKHPSDITYIVKAFILHLKHQALAFSFNKNILEMQKGF